MTKKVKIRIKTEEELRRLDEFRYFNASMKEYMGKILEGKLMSCAGCWTEISSSNFSEDRYWNKAWFDIIEEDKKDNTELIKNIFLHSKVKFKKTYYFREIRKIDCNGSQDPQFWSFYLSDSVFTHSYGELDFYFRPKPLSEEYENQGYTDQMNKFRGADLKLVSYNPDSNFFRLDTPVRSYVYKPEWIQITSSSEEIKAPKLETIKPEVEETKQEKLIKILIGAEVRDPRFREARLTLIRTNKSPHPRKWEYVVTSLSTSLIYPLSYREFIESNIYLKPKKKSEITNLCIEPTYYDDMDIDTFTKLKMISDNYNLELEVPIGTFFYNPEWIDTSSHKIKKTESKILEEKKEQSLKDFSKTIDVLSEESKRREKQQQKIIELDMKNLYGTLFKEKGDNILKISTKAINKLNGLKLGEETITELSQPSSTEVELRVDLVKILQDHPQIKKLELGEEALLKEASFSSDSLTLKISKGTVEKETNNTFLVNALRNLTEDKI